jgi:hypothetical protein
MSRDSHDWSMIFWLLRPGLLQNQFHFGLILPSPVVMHRLALDFGHGKFSYVSRGDNSHGHARTPWGVHPNRNFMRQQLSQCRLVVKSSDRR